MMQPLTRDLVRAPWFVLATLCVGAVLALAAPALAQTPQTISIDGTNDFDPSNLIENDGGDTETKNWCTSDPEDESPMDIGNIYITNDANFVYIGFEYDRDCFASPQVNLGIAFSHGAEGDGGATDAFSRKIAWNTITRKPDHYFYAVLDGFNYEAFYDWTGAAWDNVSATINPGYGSGSDGLGMANDLGFEELAIPLSAIGGLTAGQSLFVELWMTQDGTTKPPLDAAFSDGVQTSTPAGTTFDVPGAPIEMTTWHEYVIQATAVDTTPPNVTTTVFRQGEGINVTFDEPVEQTSAENTANWTVDDLGGGSLSVTSATQLTPTVVRLVTSPDPGPGNFLVTADGVEDTAGNASSGSPGIFYNREVTFEGDFDSYLQTNSSPPDDFHIEGSTFPLDFTLCSGGAMSAIGSNVYSYTAIFSFPNVGGSGSLDVEWKAAHNCLTFESIGNRNLNLTQASPQQQTVNFFWDDLDPSQFTTHAIDVVLQLDANLFAPGPSDEVGVAGNRLPLGFTAPFTPLLDDGTGEDAAAGDGIYTTVVQFPAGTQKDLGYKFTFNDVFECPETGDRTLFLNDEAFDTIGGTLGPLVMPVAYINRCYVTGRDVEVVFSVDVSGMDGDGSQPFVVELAGDVDPLSFPKAAQLMADDGVAPDLVADDNIFTTSVVFADSSDNTLEYKFRVNGVYEGIGQPNRFVVIDDSFDAVGNPQILPVADVHTIVPTGVDPTPAAVVDILREARPNPFNPKTTVVFAVETQGNVVLELFDARGRKVRTLAQKPYGPGVHEVAWDGRYADGSTASSGVYFARIRTADGEDALKLVLLK